MAIGNPQGRRVELEKTWRQDREPRIVFLSASDGRSRAAVGTGAARGLEAALEAAIDEVRAALGSREAKWLKLDLVESVGPEVRRGENGVMPVDRSLQGLAFPRQLGEALLAEELVTHTVLSSRGELIRRNVYKALLGRGAPLSRKWGDGELEDLPLRPFTAQSFFCSGDEVVPLYRGHRLWGEVRAGDLLATTDAAGAYLLRSLDAGGRFVYSYLPKTDRAKEEYNLVRHAGTIWSMLQVYALTGDAAMLAGAERAIEYLLGFIEPWGRGERQSSVLASVDRIKLGGVALTLVALAKHAELTGKRNYLLTMISLGRYLQDSQRDDGSFLSQRYYPSGKERTDFVSIYYPGEAILALVRLYGHDAKEDWLDSAELGVHYLTQVRDRGLEDHQLPHDHWLLYGIRDLYRYRPEAASLPYVLRMTRAIVDSQIRAAPQADWVGGYYIPPRTAPTATRSEGLVAALGLARAAGDDELAARVREAIELGVRFQLQSCFRPERALYLADPQRVLGGFHQGLTNFEIRIDYVQHSLSSMLGLYEELR